ncbi:MAG TPA: hypothetical protein VFI24_04685 [Pyrinomonadaceae bacterium]|nr:hypothetical protein [Pyrinomonadaceae bacterium]
MVPRSEPKPERWLVQAYSEPPFRNTELKRFLDIYVHDKTTRQRILSEVEKTASQPVDEAEHFYRRRE